MANSVIIGDYKYTSEMPEYAKAEVVDKTKSSYGNMLSSVQIGGQTCYVEDLQKCFSGCSSLVNAPALSNRANTMLQCFSGCSSLVTAPTIPKSVEQIRNCFERCQNLSGEIRINAAPHVWYDNAFKDTAKGIWLTGSNNKLANMAATANNNNVFVGEIPLSYRLTAERVAYDGQTEPVPEGLWAHVKLTIDWSNFTENSIDNITLKNGIVSINPTWYSDTDKTNAITLPNWRPNSASTTIHCWINVTSATHVLSVTVADRYHTGVVITFTVPQQFRTVEFLASGHGVAFGMPATQNGMFINMDLAIKEYSNIVKNIYDVFYPVGSYYETNLPSAIPSGQSTPTSTDLENLGVTWFDPNFAWGGTWVKVAQNTLLTSLTYKPNGNTTDIGNITIPEDGYYLFLISWQNGKPLFAGLSAASQNSPTQVLYDGTDSGGEYNVVMYMTAGVKKVWVRAQSASANNTFYVYKVNYVDDNVNRWHRTA